MTRPALLILALVVVACAGTRPAATSAAIRECVLGGEPETVEEWRELVEGCTE